ncbi:hypothetical protein K474DRAFT_1673103 [Panus rudis PR-1116 ss-1]|nr:hypothetical protein K474DRAFT_1673103 [Panus rudis PR-1116 ss-1]
MSCKGSEFEKSQAETSDVGSCSGGEVVEQIRRQTPCLRGGLVRLKGLSRFADGQVPPLIEAKREEETEEGDKSVQALRISVPGEVVLREDEMRTSATVTIDNIRHRQYFHESTGYGGSHQPIRCSQWQIVPGAQRRGLPLAGFWGAFARPRTSLGNGTSEPVIGRNSQVRASTDRLTSTDSRLHIRRTASAAPRLAAAGREPVRRTYVCQWLAPRQPALWSNPVCKPRKPEKRGDHQTLLATREPNRSTSPRTFMVTLPPVNTKNDRAARPALLHPLLVQAQVFLRPQNMGMRRGNITLCSRSGAGMNFINKFCDRAVIYLNYYSVAPDIVAVFAGDTIHKAHQIRDASIMSKGGP